MDFKAKEENNQTVIKTDDNVSIVSSQTPSNVKRRSILEADTRTEHPKTTYLETIIHLFKGNVGPGLFAMGDAFKNGGVILSPILTILIAVMCVHCQHVLLRCSEHIRRFLEEEKCRDYAETVEACFLYGPKRTQKWSVQMRVVCNIFLCVTQLGFCCVYFVFIATNLRQVLLLNGYDVAIWAIMLIIFFPILFVSLITTLKWLWWVSLVASFCMVTGLLFTLYFVVKDGMPDIQDREMFTDGWRLAIYFGTAIFAFEGIALVLPLKNVMKIPEHFDMPIGVLNVGMFLVTLLFSFAGMMGYLKWGDETGSSLTLNVGSSGLGQSVRILVSMGVLLGYPLQFFIAIQIMLDRALSLTHLVGKPVLGEMLTRLFFVCVTLGIAEAVPRLGMFISLIGSLCSTALALIFPPVMELMIMNQPNIMEYKSCKKTLTIVKNMTIIVIALCGFAVGSYMSLVEIITHIGVPEADIVLVKNGS